MPTVDLRMIRTCLPLLALLAGCDAAQPDPVGAAVQPSVSTPTPPATGIVPASGWPGGINGEAAYQRQGTGAVSFHGGIWTVPLPVRPGDSVADVGFAIEAPTGNVGDPNVVVVELVSSQSAAVLSYTNITPMGIGAYVNGDAPLSPPRVIASGETLSLVFVPLDASGNYPTNDVLVDSVSFSPPRRSHTYKLSALSGATTGGAFQIQAGNLTGNWAGNSDGDTLGVPILVEAGERIDSITSSIYGNSSYTITMSLFAQDDAYHAAADLGHQTSTLSNTQQNLTISSSEEVVSANRSYTLQFLARRLLAPNGGQPLVGPITLTTSTPR